MNHHPPRTIVKSIKARTDARRTSGEKMADWITATFGSNTFLIINTFLFLMWIVINLGFIPGIEPFDPFPFGLLTMMVSLEAIILSIFVLISQQRAAKTDDLREEIDLHIDITSEQEVTKLLQMMAQLLEKNGIDTSQDEVLQSMIKPTNLQKIEKILERQVVES